jgi:hypothetical protein
MSLVTRAMNPTFPRAIDMFKEAVEGIVKIDKCVSE